MTQAKPMVFTIIHGGEPHTITREPWGIVWVGDEAVGSAVYVTRLTCKAVSIDRVPGCLPLAERPPAFTATRRTLEEAATALAIWWLGRAK